MKAHLKFLPGTGRGTMCNMVEGAHRACQTPSVSLRLPPPRTGEEF